MPLPSLRLRISIGWLLVFPLALIILVSCSKVPGYVVKPQAMARLLADQYMAESLMEQSTGEWRDDSSKLAMRLAVFQRNGITEAQFDTSMVWYGHNLDLYTQVQDLTIEELERRVSDIGKDMSVTAVAMAVSGDSVDVWNLSPTLLLTPDGPSRILRFSLQADDNWRRGDVYAWRMKTVRDTSPLAVHLAVDYSDGSVETVTIPTATQQWRQAQLMTDSTRVPVRVSGWVWFSPDTRPMITVDSISLTRSRLNKALYYQRYRQRSAGRPKEPKTDSVTNAIHREAGLSISTSQPHQPHPMPAPQRLRSGVPLAVGDR